MTKYASGSGTSVGGIIIDGGKFDWASQKERFPLLNTPDVSYHGLTMGAMAFIARARVAPLRNTGAWVSLNEDLTIRVDEII